MSDQIKDGGPAFPASIEPNAQEKALFNAKTVHCAGMTLRDYFAAKALVGLFSMEANPRVGEMCEPFRIDKHCDDMAKHAYKLADAMMAAREKQS